jgi:hypothetical protein
VLVRHNTSARTHGYQHDDYRKPREPRRPAKRRVRHRVPHATPTRTTSHARYRFRIGACCTLQADRREIHGRCRRNRPAQSDRGGNVGEWHAQVDVTCITAAIMPRPTDRRLAVPCSGGALDDRVVAPPTAPTGASLPPEHRSHQSIAPTGAPLPLEHRSHRSHGHGSRHGASRRPTISGRSTRRTSGVYRSCPPLTRRRSCVRMAWSLDKTRTAPPRPGVLEPAAASQRRSLLGHEITISQ